MKTLLSQKRQDLLATFALIASEHNVDLSGVTPQTFRQTFHQLETLQEQAAMKGLHEYLYTKELDDYSDHLADYLTADELFPAKRKSHLLRIIAAMHKEFSGRPRGKSPDAAYLDRAKLIYLVKTIYLTSFFHNKNESVDSEVIEKTQSFLERLSKASQKGYINKIRHNSNGKSFPQDRFLSNVCAEIKNDTSDDFLKQIAAKHIQEVYDQLNIQNRKQYIDFLLKNNFNQYIPQIIELKGEIKMAEEENKNNQNPKYIPSNVELKACELAGLNPNDYDSSEKLREAVEAQNFKIQGDEILKIDGSFENNDHNNSEEKQNTADEVHQANNENSEQLTVTELDNQTPSAAAPAEENIPEWVKEKAEWYKNEAQKNNIKDYEQTQADTNGFSASFNGAAIHYASKDSVAVSKQAGIEVFETMLSEPHNQGRVVNFAPDMSPEMAARLIAACVLHGNEMTNAPQLTKEMADLLKQELGDNRFEEFKQKLEAHQQQPEQVQENAQKKTESQKEQLKQAMLEQYEMSQMEKDGKVTVLASHLPESSPYVKNENCSDEEFAKYLAMQEHAKENKQMLIDAFQKDQTVLRSLMQELMTEKNISKIASLRAQAHSNIRDSSAEERKARQTANRLENDNILKAQLGITDEYKAADGTIYKPLVGEALKEFVDKTSGLAYSYGRLGGKNEEFAATLSPSKEGGNTVADFKQGQAVKATLDSKTNGRENA